MKEDKQGSIFVNQVSPSHPPISFTALWNSIFCKLIEYVGNPRPMVIRCVIMYNKTGDSTGEA